MSEQKIFDTQIDGNALIVVPLVNTGSFAEEAVNLELDKLLEAIDRPELTSIVFDFGRIAHFGSSMLGAMHVLWKRVSSRQGRMAVCNTSDVIREIMHISKFDTIWPMFDSRQEALEAVAARGENGA